MVAFEQRMSLCHFAPTVIGGVDNNKKTAILCSYCRRPCDFVPDFHLDVYNIEMTLHRHKDGQYSAEDAIDALQEIAKRALVELLDKVGRLKYPEN